jgi:hypothetical protein
MFGWLRKPRKMTGFWAHLAPEQKTKALAYRGPEDHGAEIYLLDRWYVTERGLAELDRQREAEEKAHPSCMWDWISPDRLRTIRSRSYN